MQIGYLHRDIKPQNFASGQGKKAQTIFLLDFGLSRQFKLVEEEARSGRVDDYKDIRKPRERAPFRGTVRYASRHAQGETEQSRRDDIEG